MGTGMGRIATGRKFALGKYRLRFTMEETDAIWKRLYDV